MNSTLRTPHSALQDTPADLVDRLLNAIRGQFCGDVPDKVWFGYHRDFIRHYVILWPARFMVNKGFTIPSERYEAIMRSILQDIKHHGDTAAVQHWPGYLMKCVQDHWRHHWEEYYQEAKSARNLTERALLACKTIQPVDHTIDTLAETHRILTARKRSSRVPRHRSHRPQQMGLL